ncbi:hypothetical protein [Candidatus Poriferisocius sp.]|uniref:hypothetical protein n=1 Tax=Candidatus Poriferisocius sp. TaxID=3101276 RepID=UPI003B0185C0
MYRVVVVGRTPSPIHKSVVYSSNSNERRANLTWAEVTVLEALDYFIYTEEPWDECVERLVCGESAARLPGWGNQILVRGEALQWALETEKKQTAEKSWKVDDLAYALENSESKKVA